MDWNNLKVALAISRAGSLTRAAKKLGVDTSTAGRRLSSLEAELGIMLFVRTKTGFVLTDAGRVAIGRVAEVQNKIELLVDAVTESEQSPAGTVRLAGDTWIVSRLAEVTVPAFLNAYPQIELQTVACPAARLVQGDVSLSLWFDEEPQEGAFRISLGSVPYAFYCARNSVGRDSGWVSLSDGKTASLLVERAKRRLKRREGPTRFSSTDAGVLLNAVRAGVGKGLLPMCLAESDEGLVRINADEPAIERVLYIHVCHDTVETQRVQAAIKWLRECFASVFQPTLPECVDPERGEEDLQTRRRSGKF